MPKTLWRNAAALVLAVHPGKSSHLPPKYLMMKRSKASKFMPNLYVFPGGKLDKADCSPSWFAMVGLPEPSDSLMSHEHILSWVSPQQRRIPFHQRTQGNTGCQMTLRTSLALRICAIREAFEECGVLLAFPSSEASERDSTNTSSSSSYASMSLFPGTQLSTSTQTARVADHPALGDWQTAVARDASQFMRMCEELKLRPDIGSLTEWSNWLTPMDVGPSRFDTWFFLAGIDSMPTVTACQFEVADIQTHTAVDYLKALRSGSLALPPPQVYEMCRLQKFNSMDTLLKYSAERQSQGLDKWMPVRIACSDAIISAMPGDDLYPACPDVRGDRDPLEVDMTYSRLREIYPRRHCMVLHDDPSLSGIDVNIPGNCGQEVPMVDGSANIHDGVTSSHSKL